MVLHNFSHNWAECFLLRGEGDYIYQCESEERMTYVTWAVEFWTSFSKRLLWQEISLWKNLSQG